MSLTSLRLLACGGSLFLLAALAKAAEGVWIHLGVAMAGTSANPKPFLVAMDPFFFSLSFTSLAAWTLAGISLFAILGGLTVGLADYFQTRRRYVRDPVSPPSG